MTDESRKIEMCKGFPERSMRTWRRGLTLAMTQTPQVNLPNAANQATVDKELGRKLMARTSAGPLVAELDKEIAAHPNHTVDENLELLQATFLGTDEPAAKRGELEKMCQAGGIKLKIPYLLITASFRRCLMRHMPL